MQSGRRLFTGIWRDFGYSLGTLLRNPGFTTVAVATLALGIGANTAIFSVVEAVLLRQLPYPDSHALVRVAEKGVEQIEGVTTSFGTWTEWKQRSRSFEGIAVYRQWQPALTGAGEPELISGLRVTSGFLSLLRVTPALGRDFLPAEDHPDSWRVVLLSDAFWKRRFGGDPGLVGRSITLNERPYTVVGILPAGLKSFFYRGDNPDFEVWAPLGYDASQSVACRSCRHLRALGRLKADVTAREAAAELTAIEHTLASEFPTEYAPRDEVDVRPLLTNVAGGTEPALYTLLVAVGLILLIACANVANLLLARSTTRRKEFALRAALGASRTRLARQMIVESLTLSSLGGIVGVFLATWSLYLLRLLAPGGIGRLDEVHLNTTVLGFTLGATIATGILFGLAPALQACRLDPHEALKQGARDGLSQSRPVARRSLAVLEVALAFSLLLGAGLLLKSFYRVAQVDPGFEPEGVFTAQIALSGSTYREESQVAEFFERVLERLRNSPGIESAGVVTPLPLSDNFDRAGFHIRERQIPSAQAPSVDRFIVSPDYLPTMRIPVLRGRGFTAQDRGDSSRVALVSKTLADLQWPGEDPLGKQIQLGGRDEDGPWDTVVGVVGDVRQQGLDSPPTMQAYLPHAQVPYAMLQIVVRSGLDRSALEGEIREAVWSLDKNQPVFDMETMPERLSHSLSDRRFTMLLLSAFGALALILAVIGVYGVLSYSVSLRTRDMGIRIALGANRRNVLGMVLGEGGVLALVGIALGAAMSLPLVSLMSKLLFGVSPHDPLTALVGGMALASASLLACYLPARRAAAIDPMEALRSE